MLPQLAVTDTKFGAKAPGALGSRIPEATGDARELTRCIEKGTGVPRGCRVSLESARQLTVKPLCEILF